MKQFNYVLGALVLAMAIGFSSCEKNPVVRDTTEVSFEFDVVTDLLKKDNGILTGDDVICPDNPNPTTVELTIDGQDYTLNVLSDFENGNQTSVIQLEDKEHTLTKFVVKDDIGTIIYATPEKTSKYGQLYSGVLDGVELKFTTEKFRKTKISVDVLCFEEFKYESFGFNWFEFNAYATKTLCFFGDICTELYQEWHDYQGSVANPYENQYFEGYDFPAIFRVEVKGQGWTTTADNLADLGEMTVCVDYLDNLQIPNEQFNADIYLLLPDGSEALLGSVPFTDADQSNSDDPNSFGGDNGVYEFAVGNCGNRGPTYGIPNFSRVWMTLKGDNNGSASYVDIKFRVEGLTPYSQIVDGALLDGWCVEKDWNISYNTEYEINLYSSLNESAMPSYLQGKFDLVALNYLANNLDTYVSSYGKTKVQDAIWHFSGDISVPGNSVVVDVLANSVGFDPQLGSKIFVICEPINNPNAKIQLMAVRNPNE